MAFSRDTIAAVKERADIVEVIGERVRLAPSGANFVGLCPFHGEKTPSFHVSPSRGSYHCFGCQAGGSVIDFVMNSDNLSFPEAVTALAERYGVPLPDNGRGEGGGRSLAALACAQDYYQDLLLRRPEGEAARRYLSGRGFTEPDWEAFGLGCALEQWQGFTQHGRSQGFGEEDLQATGLVRSGSGRLYDLLRNRVMFPIANDSGRPIAFAGRSIDPLDEPKYLNIPETRHYHKKQVLFGMPQAREALRQSRRALLVEGYLDVMRLHQHGFGGALATCGTALTEGHLKALSRHADRSVLLFDGDEPGVKAALRCAPLFLNQGLEARVVLLPDGLDPDDFLLTRGAEGLSELLEEASPLLEFLVFQMLRRNGNTHAGKERTVEALVPVLAQVAKPAARDLAVRFLSDLLGVRSESVTVAVERASAPRKASTSAAAPLFGGREERHQRRVLRLLLEEPALLAPAREMLQPSDMTDPESRTLLERLYGFADEEYARMNPGRMEEMFPELAPAIRGLLLEEPLHQSAISKDPDWRREMESEILCIKESLKDELFRQLKSLEGSPEQGEALSRFFILRDELRHLKTRFRQTHRLRPEATLKEPPAPKSPPA